MSFKYLPQLYNKLVNGIPGLNHPHHVKPNDLKAAFSATAEHFHVGGLLWGGGQPLLVGVGSSGASTRTWMTQTSLPNNNTGHRGADSAVCCSLHHQRTSRNEFQLCWPSLMMMTTRPADAVYMLIKIQNWQFESVFRQKHEPLQLLFLFLHEIQGFTGKFVFVCSA